MKKKIIDAAYIAVIVFSIIFVVRLGFKAYKSGEEAKVVHNETRAYIKTTDLKEALDNNFNRSDEILLQKFDSLLEVHYGTTSNTLKQ